MNFNRIIKELKVSLLYKKQQANKDNETLVNREDLIPLSSAWEDNSIAGKQKIVVDKQLENYREGYLDPVFKSLIDTLNQLSLKDYSLLDAACASGYYSLILQSEFGGKFRYTGCDYSEGMVEMAKSSYPKYNFSKQDITSLSFSNLHFETLLMSGVLEHIPNYELAISEACRVASKYVILHRCLVSGKDENIYSTGFLYHIKTPRIYYSLTILEREFLKNGFKLINTIRSEAYQGFINKTKLFIKKYILRRRFGIEYTYTFQRL